MYKIQVLDNISQKGLNMFKPDCYEVSATITNPDVILVRSHSLHDHAFPTSLRAVGRAGTGTDNIPVAALTAQGIPVFYAPGANANAVKELVLAAILMGYRRLDDARRFLLQTSGEDSQAFKTTIEKQKKSFVGHEIAGKTLGVLGLGNIGVRVANAALGLGMRVIAYDPNVTLTNAHALMPSVDTVMDMQTVLQHADIITIHVPLMAETTHLINENNIHLLKPNTLLLNFSREAIVSEAAIRQLLDNKKIMGYITDFPTHSLATHPQVLSFPHLGASTHEAEQNSAEMVIGNICNYLEHGIVEHAINFPNIAMPPAAISDCHRVLIINNNVPGIIGKITQKLSTQGCNIEQMVNTSREAIAINLIDVSGMTGKPQALLALCKSIEGVLQGYVIH